MSKMSMFKEIFDGVNEVSFQEILINLLDGEQNLDLKTHIIKPKQVTSLETITEYLKNNKCNNSGKILAFFTKRYKRNMVSFNRLSRIEIIKAVSSLLEADSVSMNFSEKMTKNLK